jgi:hypothetical protein
MPFSWKSHFVSLSVDTARTVCVAVCVCSKLYGGQTEAKGSFQFSCSLPEGFKEILFA